MYVFMHWYMCEYVCMYVYVYTCVYVCVCIYVYMCICIYVCMCIYPVVNTLRSIRLILLYNKITIDLQHGLYNLLQLYSM